MNIRTELKQIKKKLTVGSRLIYVPIQKDEDFFTAAQRLIDSGNTPAIIPLKKILKEINRTSMGLPSEEEKMIFQDECFSMINVLSGETFTDCIKRLKAYRITPEIYT